MDTAGGSSAERPPSGVGDVSRRRDAAAMDTPGEDRSRVATVVLVCGLAVLAVTLLWGVREVRALPLGVVLATGAALGWSVRLPALRRLWDAVGIPVFTALIALVVVFTGGGDSIYGDLLLLVPVTTALLRRLRVLVLSLLAVLLAAAAPVLYDSVPPTFLADVVADAALWAAAAAVVFVQTRARARQEAELRRATEVKSAFLRAISHELRTPLTVVRGVATLVRVRHEDLTADQRSELLERLDANGRRLERLLVDLLDVDRLLRGTVEAVTDPVDLAEVTDAVVAGLESGGERVLVEAAPTVVAGDRAKLERVVENLVSNALRHGARVRRSGAGGPCDGRPQDDGPGPGHVRIRVRPLGAHGELVVEDDGPGIPPELRDRLFEPFEQGEAVAADPCPGAGIGLALVDRLVRLHGGSVEAGDRPGGGARFVVRLPRAQREVAGRREASTAPAAHPAAKVATSSRTPATQPGL